MTYIFHDFPQFLHSHAGIMPEVRSQQLSYASFPIPYSRIIETLVAVWPEILIMSLNKEITIWSWVGVDLAGISPQGAGENQELDLKR
jgi:hypothetical protein